ncbi:protein Fyv10p [[Candida] anglica]|uniref:Protein Fyv10p n=1 Tax=[Candida] anglica TaxID=148631 RepID=A0ABP0EJ05_9ASCO
MADPTINFHVQTRSTQFKIPTELLKKNFKAVQKLLEKQKKTLAEEATKVARNESLPAPMRLQLVRKLVRSAEQFHQRLVALAALDREYRERLVARNAKLQQLRLCTVKGGKQDQILDLNSYTLINWYRDETNLAIVEYLIRTSGSELEVPVKVSDTDELVGVSSIEEEEMEIEIAPFSGIARPGIEPGIAPLPPKKRKTINRGVAKVGEEGTSTTTTTTTTTSASTDGSTGSVSLGIDLLNHLSQKNPELYKLIDYDVYHEFNHVHRSIQRFHTLSPVSAWFNENKPLLKKIHSNLDFEIKYCRLLSLIEEGKVGEAMRYSHENLSSYGNKDNYDKENDHRAANLDKLKRIGGLLLYLSVNTTTTTTTSGVASGGVDATTAAGASSTGASSTDSGGACAFGSSSLSNSVAAHSPGFQEHRKLLSHGRWQSLAQCFVDDFTRLYGISKTYPLFVYLSAGISSLKTKSCYCNYENTVFDRPDTPGGIDTHPAAGVAATTPVAPLSSSPAGATLDRSSPGDVASTSPGHTSPGHTSPGYTSASTSTGSRSAATPGVGPNEYYKRLHKVNNCPVCSPELFQLGQNLPYAQLITRIFNNPHVLPNGNIYAFDKLLQLAQSRNKLHPQSSSSSSSSSAKLFQTVQDPLTKEEFLVDDCVRVYAA